MRNPSGSSLLDGSSSNMLGNENNNRILFLRPSRWKRTFVLLSCFCLFLIVVLNSNLNSITSSTTVKYTYTKTVISNDYGNQNEKKDDHNKEKMVANEYIKDIMLDLNVYDLDQDLTVADMDEEQSNADEVKEESKKQNDQDRKTHPEKDDDYIETNEKDKDDQEVNVEPYPDEDDVEGEKDDVETSSHDDENENDVVDYELNPEPDYIQKRFNNDAKNDRNKEYLSEDGKSTTAKYALYRAIGNDLPPRHALGQSYNNVKFILENEPKLDGVVTRWIVNRIAVPSEEKRIIDLLESHQQTYIHIPVHLKDYDEIDYNINFVKHDITHGKVYRDLPLKKQVFYTDLLLHYKNLYIMHNNAARNAMIEDGIEDGAEWVFPFDGNCYFTEAAWQGILDGMKETLTPNMKYFTIPMVRLQDNDVLFQKDFAPEAKEEPQVAFRKDAKERFNEDMRYGRRPKVEILWRLEVPGPWDKWPQSVGVWDKPTWTVSTDKEDPIPGLSWVARLFSGSSKLEGKGALVDRGVSRSKGIERLLIRKDEEALRKLHNFRPKDTLFTYKEDILAKEKKAYQEGNNEKLNALVEKLIVCAEDSLKQGPFSVVDKSEKPPSKDKHDYYSPSPYFWPDPEMPDGLPYIRKDGERVPGTELFDAESEKYDRTRLASFYGNTTCLGLAWYFTDREDFAEKAALNMKTWFLDPEKKMNPNLKYAQIRWGHNDNMGVNFGIIETKDFYFFLDIVRLVHRSGHLDNDDMTGIRKWFKEFQYNLENSKQGEDEYYVRNNHGLYYDAQVASISAFVDDIPVFLNHTARAFARLKGHFEFDGSLPHELARPTQLHYLMFTMQGWYTLGRIVEETKRYSMFQFKPAEKHCPECSAYLKMGSIHNIPYFNQTWSNFQEDIENMDRMLPLYFQGLQAFPEFADLKGAERYPKPHLYDSNPMFDPHSAIQPFWNLGLSENYL